MRRKENIGQIEEESKGLGDHGIFSNRREYVRRSYNACKRWGALEEYICVNIMYDGRHLIISVLKECVESIELVCLKHILVYLISKILSWDRMNKRCLKRYV